MSHYSPQELGEVIGQIYDCAVDPGLWIPTLTGIRDRMKLAMVHIQYVQKAHAESVLSSQFSSFRTDWEADWLERLTLLVKTIPGADAWYNADIDQSISQMQIVSESDFKASDFYKTWVFPQGLRDSSSTSLLKRQCEVGVLTATSYQDRALFDDIDRQMFSLLAPHIRRSLLISGMLDEGKLQLQLYRKLLDRIGAGVLIVGKDANLVYANEIADGILSKGSTLTVRQNKVLTASRSHAQGFAEALDRACTENDSDIGTFGNGIPLTGPDGSVAVCYVLPLGKSDRRRELGPGLAALFITTQGNSIPPALEVLSALSGLTSREARIALLVADGQSPQETAQTLGISVHTVRTHLAHVFEKTGTNSQMALGKFIGKLSLPVTGASER